MRAYVGAVREQAPDLGVMDILGITPEQGFAAFAQIPNKILAKRDIWDGGQAMNS